MEFCKVCGSYMTKTQRGYVCPQCGKEISTKIIEYKDFNNVDSPPIDVIENRAISKISINQVCPQCGNGKAFRQITSLSGDHAGIEQDKTIERFKCTKCSHIWSKR